MARVTYYTATTADGFIADADNSLQWLFDVPDPPDDGGAWDAFLGRIGALVLGRTTYEWVLDHEDLLAHPEKWKGFYGDRPSWVFSHHELPPLPGCDVRFVGGDVAALHDEVVASADGRDVWVVGGGDLAGQYADAGLLDEIIVTVTPVFLGSGAPLLPRRLTSERVRVREVVHRGQHVRIDFDVTGPT
jgi:dihydrofolate reductase